ncbi:MAG: transposase [Verrucomicrobiia bacterium]|jgi:REP element-mobilizing transposase RayT
MADLPNRRRLRRIPVWLPLDSPVVYFVTVCCCRRQRIFIADDPVRVATACLRRCQARHGWEVSQTCFMPDHVHLFAAPLREREQSLAEFMRAWKSAVTLRLGRERIWQAGFFDHLLRSDESAERKWEYVRQNPVRAGLCERPEDYAWSGTPEEILRRIGTVL